MSEKMISEAIILAGGLGTRLRPSVADLPKCMAPVAGKPFIAHVAGYLLEAGVQRLIFALGYKSNYFYEFLHRYLPPQSYDISCEEQPLGTGGAIRLACSHIKTTQAIVLNGDTLFRINVKDLSYFHLGKNADCTLCLKPMQAFDRYGAVELEKDGQVKSFREKQFFARGLINGGVYAINTSKFLEEDLPERFSFEKDYLEKMVARRRFFGLVQDAYFIDIGVPDDYKRAQSELAAAGT
jgi:D-glycero-alpha-D-manno-heptose 1-phosphate guanylyltransferase